MTTNAPKTNLFSNPWFSAGMLGASGLGSFFSGQQAGKTNLVQLPPPGAIFPGAQQGFMNQLFQANPMQGAPTGLGPDSLRSIQMMAKNGMPLDVMPMWQAMISAQQQSQQQGRANLMEKYGSQGMRFSTPMATAARDYETQTQKDWGNTLAQLTYGAGTDALNRMMQASQYGAGLYSNAANSFYPTAMPVTGGPSGAGNAFQAVSQALSMMAMIGMM